MKCIVFFILFFFCESVQSQKISDKIIPLFTLKINATEAPEGYGLSPDKPILTGVFLRMDQMEQMMVQMGKFYNTFRWPSGEMLDYSKRTMTKGPKGEILDCYAITKPGSGEIMKLYVNAYQEGDVYLPKGLVFIDSKTLEPMISRFIKNIEEFNKTPDAFSDSTSKERQAETLMFLQQSVGLSVFYNDEIVKKLSDPKNVPIDLGGYLYRTYIFNSFLALAKGKEDEKSFGKEKMKEAYRNVLKSHPEMANPWIGDWLDVK